MKIIILGAGQVGASVAQNLVSENNDITVVDMDAANLKSLQNNYDLRTLVGNGAWPSVLTEAGAQDADMLISVTSSDQTNLVACKIARTEFNLPMRIARLRASDYLHNSSLLSESNFAVDFALCPEEILTNHIAQLIEYPGALQVLEFGDGRLIMVAMRACEGGRLVGRRLKEIHEHLPAGTDARIAGIFRKGRPLVPRGETVIEEDDEVFILAAREHIRFAMLEIHPLMKPIKRIMIAGGGNIGKRVAVALEKSHEIKLIEMDYARCEYLANRLPNTLVLHGDATDDKLLEQESVDSMDVFIALTNDDEDNIMSSLLAKHLHCKCVISLINRQIYANLSQAGRIDIAISPAQISIGVLLAMVRKGDVTQVHSLRHGVAEALEIVAHGDAKTSKVIGRKIADLPIVAGASISAILRSSDEGEEGGKECRVIMPYRDVVIECKDHVIVFCQNKKVVKEVEKLFEVDIGFL